jgi:hypothetical protein
LKWLESKTKAIQEQKTTLENQATEIDARLVLVKELLEKLKSTQHEELNKHSLAASHLIYLCPN